MYRFFLFKYTIRVFFLFFFTRMYLNLLIVNKLFGINAHYENN